MRWCLIAILSTSLILILSCENDSSDDCDGNLSNQLKEFADNNWTLDDWVTNRFAPPTQIYESMSWTNFPALNRLTGTHGLTLIVSGDLANEINLTLVSSDSLEYHPEWLYSGNLVVQRDDDFYVIIGRYDQFLGGWSDARDEWYWEEIDVGDSTEIVIKTPMKDNYLVMLKDCNNSIMPTP